MMSQSLRVLAQRSVVPTRRLLTKRCTTSHASPTLPFVAQRHRPMSTPAPQLIDRFDGTALLQPSCSITLSFYSLIRSGLSMERYHLLSDATMDTLLEALENLLDGLGNARYEVEYHVRTRDSVAFFVFC